MLFFNFLCLFYLMVLVDSHTISKSIAKDDEIINVVDSIRDLESDRERDVKQNRFHIRNGYQADPIGFRKAWTPKYTKLDVSTVSSDNGNVTRYVQVTGKSNDPLVTMIQRKGFFGRLLDRLKGKKKKQFITNDMMAQIQMEGNVSRDHKYRQPADKTRNHTKDSDDGYVLVKQRNRRKRLNRLYKRRGDSDTTLRTDDNEHIKSLSSTGNDDSVKGKRRWLIENYTWKNNFPFTSMRPSQQTLQKSDELSLTELTTKIENLKEMYNMKTDSYTNLMSVMLNPSGPYNYNKYTTLIEDSDKYMVETSEIEAILNNIKMNAIETITKGFVTELGIIPLSYRSTTSATFRNNVKRNLNANHNISNYVNVDELKKMLIKVKSQLCKEIKVSEGIIRNETKYWYHKLRGPVGANATGNRHVLLDYDIVRNSRFGNKVSSSINYSRTSRATDCTSTQPPADDDDYDMITKSEMLLDYQEHPVSFSAIKSDYQNSDMHTNKSSRNEIVLTNLQRKTAEHAADYDAMADSKVYEDYDVEAENEKPIEKVETNTRQTNPVTTDFKNLAEKLYYNDYVNGYKHYLKFQKEQGVQNYSNLVRYQAHRHHSVDDIGKFILNKLPTLPKRYKRAFYDASETTEDQDISTKNEESWFKKHFYVFIDSGQPKKYHSSQTVSLRPLATDKNRFEPSRDSATNANENLIMTTEQQRQSEDADLDQLANVLRMFKSQTTSSLEKFLKHGMKIEPMYRNNKMYDSLKLNEKDKNTTTEVNVDLLLESVLHRPARNTKTDDVDSDYQLYQSYMPQVEYDSLKELSSEPSRRVNKKSEKQAYVKLKAATRPTAVVKLRNARREGKLRKFLNRFRFHFHKNKNKQMAKSILKKRDSPRTIKSINPLKKLKKMFNVRIDGKPDIVLSKMFDYDMLDNHVTQLKHVKYDKPPPNLEDIKVDIPTVIPESPKVKSFSKDLPFKTTVPNKFFPHTGIPEKTDATCGNETVNEPCPVIMTTKTTPPPTTTVFRSIIGSAKNRPDFNDADLINIKVTTVKTLNEYTTRSIYDFAAAPYKSMKNKINDISLIRRFTAFVTPNKMSKENLQNIYLSSINSEDNIIDTGKFKHNDLLQSRIVPTTHSHLFSYIQFNDASPPSALSNSSNIEKNVRQAQLVTMPLYDTSSKRKKLRLLSNKRPRYSNSRRRYQTPPNYFNDLEMWHNDILDSDKYTTWQNILKTIQQPFQYKPPDMMALKNELHRLDKLLDNRKPPAGDKPKNKIKHVEQASKSGKSYPATGGTNEFSINKMVKRFDKKNHKIKRRDVDSLDVLSPLRYDDRLEVPGLLSTQYRRILHPSFFVTHSVQIEDPPKNKTNQDSSNVKEVSTAEITSFDTTLLAYDDSLNILRVHEETTPRISHHGLSPVNILTKLHKVPEQHFSTPLPMKNEDFENFLRDYNIDVKSVTSPIYFPSPEGLKGNDPILAIEPNLFNQTTEQSHVQEAKNLTRAMNRSTITSSKKKQGRYCYTKSATEIDRNKYSRGYNGNIVANLNSRRIKRSALKAPSHYRGLPTLDYLGAELLNKYVKVKSPHRNSSRQHIPTTESAHNLTDKMVDEDNEYFFDTLEDQLHFGKVDMPNDILDGSKNEKHEDNGNVQHLQEHNLKLTHKYIDVFPIENKIKINISELSKTFSEVLPVSKPDEGHAKSIATEKYKPVYSHLVHNNLLFNSKPDKKQDILTKEKNSAGDLYKQSKGNGDFSEHSPLEAKPTNKNYFDYDLFTSSKRTELSTKTSKYDFLLDEISSKDKRNGNHDISAPRLKVFGNSGFYSKNIQEFLKETVVGRRGPQRRRKRNRRQKTIDLERFVQAIRKVSACTSDRDEQIKELVRVVEAVENFTRPNVVVHIDLPTYYLPDPKRSDYTPLPSPPKSIWNDFILKYVSGIALLELLTKFGILRTVEPSLSDGMDEGANACGLFSGVAEPRSATDLMTGDRIRRIPSSVGERNQVTDLSKLPPTTTLEPRRGTIIYDLKQLSRPHSVAMKPRRGPYKKGTSVFAMQQNQIEVSINESSPAVITSTTSKPRSAVRTSSNTQKSTVTISVKTSRATTPAAPKAPMISQSPYKTKNTEKTTTPASKTSTTTEKRVKVVTPAATRTTASVVRDKLTKNTTPLKEITKLNTKQTFKPENHKNGEHRFMIVTTKIFSKKVENKPDNDELINIKNSLPTISMAKLTNVENATTAAVADVANTKRSSCPPLNTTLDTTTTSNATTPTTTELATRASSTLNPTEELKELDEESLYITSNYYDYHTADIDYTEDENKFETFKTTTKAPPTNATNKHGKRDVKSQNTFTAKDVAAIEVIVDLMRKNRNLNDDMVGMFNDMTNKSTSTEQRSTKTTQNFIKTSDTISNSIQVHIAIPCNITIDKRRSLNEPVRIRKVFTARLSTPVDIEYQIHSVEDVDPLPTEATIVIPAKNTTSNITCNTIALDAPNNSTSKNITITNVGEITPRAEKLSPGLYVLVENQSIPDGQFILKPVDSSKLLPDYKIKEDLSDTIVTPKGITASTTNNLAKVTLSKDFIAVINKHLMELYQYLMTTKEHKRKQRDIDIRNTTRMKRRAKINHLRQGREINWDTLKKYIGHDKVCYCHCKPNRTMCRACAASDAVISELIFELDNLAQYMNDHCTEIQTYFWVNPSGGRKLRDAVHRIDKTLYDYFKRVSGKCKGRPCKVFMYMDKRDFVNPDNKSNYIGDPLIHDVEKLADHLEQALKFNIGDENLLDSGTKCLDIITKCMHLKSFDKRANEGETRRIKNVYSLDNVNVNIICKSDKLDSTQRNIYDTTIPSPAYVPGSSGIFYYDDSGDYTKEDSKRKGIKSLLSLKGYPKKKRKDRNHWFPYNITPTSSNVAKKNVKKRHLTNNYQIESSLNEDGIESKWFNYLKDKTNKDQFNDETTNTDVPYKYVANENKTETLSTASPVDNSTKYDVFGRDEATAEGVDRYYSVAAYTLYRQVITDVSQPRKRMKMNSMQPPKPKARDSTFLPHINNFTKYKENKPSRSNFHKIQYNRKTTLLQSTRRTNDQRTQVRTEAVNITKTSKRVYSVSNSFFKNDAKLHKSSQQNSFRRFKDATLNYLSNSTHSLMNTLNTSPVASFRSTTTPNSLTIRSSITKKKQGMKSHNFNDKGHVTVSGHAGTTNLPTTLKQNLVKVPLKNKLLKEELLFSSTTMSSVTKDNKELLLSILDFETNKLNDEWQRIALKKTAEDDVDDDGQSIFQLHSEVLMSNEKSKQNKDEHTVTAVNMGHEVLHDKNPNKHNQAGKQPHNPGKATTNKHKPKQSTTTDSYYDIRHDLPPIEIEPPPGICRTKICHSLLDKFLDKFKFKVLPGARKEKVAKSHQNGPKGRSLKRKMEHGKRVRGKAPSEHSAADNATNSVSTGVTSQALDNSSCDSIEDTRARAQQSNHTPSTAATTAKKVIKINESKANEHPKKMNYVSKDQGCGEVHEPSAAWGPLCDIDATIIHVLDMYRKLSACEFRLFVKNITCYSNKSPPPIFQIRDSTKTKRSRQHGASEQNSKIWRWNWVRGKRSSEPIDSLADITYRNDIDYDYVDDDNNRNAETKYPADRIRYVLGNDNEDYDKLYLGTDGVYRGKENERRKRKTVDMTSVVSGLTNLPPLRELVDEIFVIRGKSITIFCNVSGTPVYSVSNLTNMYRYTWTAERKAMLGASNLKIVGPSLVLTAIEPKNFGTYTCSQDKIVTRSVRVNVIEIPDFNIVFTPLYRCLGECTYEDLENIQNLGLAMEKSANCCGVVSSTIRVDQPISLSDQQNEDLLKPTIVITAVAPADIECGPECRRDLTCSLALLWASNAPTLASVKVVIIYDKFNNTLTPVDSNLSKMSLSKKLKSKDSNGHREYQVLSRSMSPGDVDVVVACPAGYYLLTDQKICAVCPANTCAAAGENTCSPCPRGTHSDPGAAACRLGLSRLHRYDNPVLQSQRWQRWQWWPRPSAWQWCWWQWCVVVCGVVCAGCACAAGGLSARRHAHCTTPTAACPPAPSAPAERCSGPGLRRLRRPLSPSRVILERLYKRSQSSSRATDSQDTKFVITEHAIGPPPLPPIDFE